ncbi:MAG: hypothetical protein ACSHXB_04585 [Sulfitobacter sp.]
MQKLSFICAALAASTGPVWADQIVPSDMAPTCVVSGDTIKQWFDTGSIAANGKVNAPKSVSFTSDYNSNPDDCDFYKWGAQMFLWLTSTDEGKHVLDGPGFFTVAPADSSKTREFIANTTSSTASLQVRSEKTNSAPGDDTGEFGQAGSSGVLMSQGKSLVYYGLAVNDAYAYFLSGQKTSAPSLADKTTFPANDVDLDALKTYLAADWPDVKLLTGDQLAMELKTSWVEAKTLENPEDYLIVSGTIPNFVADKSNKVMKVDKGKPTKTVDLALTGMHVVGTVQNHPEFVWATFEHVTNVPDAPYYYLADDGTTTLNSYDSDHDFLFMARGDGMDGANTECMQAADGEIKANLTGVEGDDSTVCDGGIVPSNTLRQYPWGSLANDTSSKTIANNTLLLSINHSVRSQLADADVRRNYIQTGSVWTDTPSEYDAAPIPNQLANQAVNLAGSTNLTNMTLETYTQGTNCFSCHALSPGTPNSFEPFGLSHIYSQLKPLKAAN